MYLWEYVYLISSLLVTISTSEADQIFANNGAADTIKIVEDNQLSPNIILEAKSSYLVQPKGQVIDVPVLKSNRNSLFDNHHLNEKLIEQKLNEKSKIKTNINIYETNIPIDNDNGLGQPGSSQSGGELYQQIAAVSQMRNRYKPKNNVDVDRESQDTSTMPTNPEADMSLKKKTSSLRNKLKLGENKWANKIKNETEEFDIGTIKPLGNEKDLRNDGNDKADVNKREAKNQLSTKVRTAKHIDPYDESIKPIYGSSYSKITPLRIVKRSPSHKCNCKKKGKHGRKRRSVNTDYVNKKGKEYDFITSAKLSSPPPIVRVVPNDNLYYRHGRADEKQFPQVVQSSDRDVQELIRHNVQQYIQPSNLNIQPNGNNEYLNQIEKKSRNGNQKRIIYYANLPEIVRRPNSIVHDMSPIWTNYMIPRELPGSANQENEIIKVQSTIIDIKEPNKVLIPIQTIQPSARSEMIQPNLAGTLQSNPAGAGSIQQAPYYVGTYPTRHDRYPELNIPLLMRAIENGDNISIVRNQIYNIENNARRNVELMNSISNIESNNIGINPLMNNYNTDLPNNFNTRINNYNTDLPNNFNTRINNYNTDLPNNFNTRIKNIQNNLIPKTITIQKPKSYKINGRRYGIYNIPTLNDDNKKSIYDEIELNNRYDKPFYNDKDRYDNYEKYYNLHDTSFDKPIDYDNNDNYQNENIDINHNSNNDFDNTYDLSISSNRFQIPPNSENFKNQLPAERNLTKSSFSVKYLPKSITYLPNQIINTVKIFGNSTGNKKDIENHSSNLIHTVKIESNIGQNSTMKN